MSWYDGDGYSQGPGGFGYGDRRLGLRAAGGLLPDEDEEEDRRRRGRHEPYEYVGGERDTGYGPMRGAPQAYQRVGSTLPPDRGASAPRNAAAVDSGAGPSPSPFSRDVFNSPRCSSGAPGPWAGRRG